MRIIITKIFTSRFSLLWLPSIIMVASCNILCNVDGSDSTSVAEQARFSRLPPTVFAPSGRLHRVERVCQETTDSLDITSPLVVAMKCEGGKKLALVFTAPLSPFLVQDYNCDSSSNSNNSTEIPLSLQRQHQKPSSTLSFIGQKLLIATAGNAMASTVLQRKIQRIVLSMIQREESIEDPAIIARYTADLLQIATQSVADEDHPAMLASSAIIIGSTANNHWSSNNHNLSTTPFAIKLWRVDPTGQFWDCEAAAIGRGAKSAESWLMRHLFNITSDSRGKAIQENGTANIFDQHEKMGNDTSVSDDEILQDDSSEISNGRVKIYIENLTATEALILLKKCITETLSTSIPATLQTSHKSMRTWGELQGVVVHSTVVAEHGSSPTHPMKTLYGKSSNKGRRGRKITLTIFSENKLQLLS